MHILMCYPYLFPLCLLTQLKSTNSLYMLMLGFFIDNDLYKLYMAKTFVNEN